MYIYIYRDFILYIIYITVYLQKHRRGLELQTRWTLGNHSPVEIGEKIQFDSWGKPWYTLMQVFTMSQCIAKLNQFAQNNQLG